MKKLIKEQKSKIDLLQFRDVYKCPFLIGSEYGSSKKFTNGENALRKVATSDSEFPKTSNDKNYVKGDILYIKSDYTYDVVRNGNKIKEGLPWKCSTLGKDEVKPQLTKDQERSIQDKINFYKSPNGEPLYQRETPTADQMNDFEKINLKDETDFKDLIKFDYFIWKRKGLRQSSGPQQKEIIRTYLSDGFLDLGGKLNPAEAKDYATIDLNTKYPTEFPNSYKLYKKLDSLGKNDIIRTLTRLTLKNESDKSSFCANFIKYYVTAQKLRAGNLAQIDSWKVVIDECKKNHTNYYDLGITKRNLKDLDKAEAPYGFLKKTNTNTENSTEPAMTESNIILKNIVKENLEKTLKNKRKKIISEQKTINKRFEVIVESANFNTKKQKEQFFDKILYEINYLNSKNYNENLINEGLGYFWDMLKGVFGYGVEGLMGSFKEYLAKLIINKLTPMDPDGWFGQLISTSIGNLNISDIGKLTDCKFLSKWMTKNVVETAIAKMQTGGEYSDPIFVIIRNGIMDAIDDTQLAQNIENGIANFICPSIKNVGSKMTNLVDKTKETLIKSAPSALQPIQSNE